MCHRLAVVWHRSRFITHAYLPLRFYSSALYRLRCRPSSLVGLARQTTNTISFFRRLFSRPVSPGSMSAAKTKVQGIIDDNSIAVFSKSYCPYCRATKQLLHDMGAKPYIVELDEVDDGAAMQDALEDLTGQRTVPNVFIKQTHIGGNSELQARRSQLPQLLSDANAI